MLACKVQQLFRQIRSTVQGQRGFARGRNFHRAIITIFLPVNCLFEIKLVHYPVGAPFVMPGLKLDKVGVSIHHARPYAVPP